MSSSPATYLREGPASARTTRDRKARAGQLRRPRTVAVAEHERIVNKAVPVEKSTWLERAKVYEESFVKMKNRNAVKKKGSSQRSHIPKAYDIEEHLYCGQGVVVIGKNGVVTNDKYYVKCMKRSRPEPSTGSDLDSSFLSSEDECSTNNNDLVPLCWQQQLLGKDMLRICQATASIPSVSINNTKNQGKDTEKLKEDAKKKTDIHPYMYIMLSWGSTSILEWKDCLPPHLHPSANNVHSNTGVVDDSKAPLPGLEVLLDHIKEHDHSLEWRHINSTLCIWLSWSHINKDNTYEVYVTDNASVCTRVFTGVKARIVYDNIYIMHFDLVKSLPWITSLSEIQGKHFNINISRSNPLLRTEVKLLCEDVQLGNAFEDNWCNPRTLSHLVSHINNFEDLDEDKMDLLAISDLLPDLLKFSPNSSLDASQEQSRLTSAIESIEQSLDRHPSQSDDSKSVLITQKSLLWQQSPVTSGGHPGNALLHDKGHLLNTELALSRTIRNYNSKRHHSPAKGQKGKGLNSLVRPNTSVGYRLRARQRNNTKSTERPRSGVVHKKSSTSCKTSLIRPFSIAQDTNTNTAKDLELLTKSICKHLSIKDNLQ